MLVNSDVALQTRWAFTSREAAGRTSGGCPALEGVRDELLSVSFVKSQNCSVIWVGVDLHRSSSTTPWQ